ncbi:MAG: Fe(3+) ABC transporter substrate-binding protein [Gammaproteobacteria bacterium]
MKNPLAWALCALAFTASHAFGAEVNVYSAREEALIKPLLDRFTQETEIKVNLVTGEADALLARLISEGRNTPADIFITVDAGRLHRAKREGMLQPLGDPALERMVPAQYRDPEGYWIGLSRRARVIFYAKRRIDPAELSTYENLAEPKWKNRLCVRSSDNIYNQSLVASLIAADGEAATESWARALVANMARSPQGGDRDQITAVAAGQCDLAIANTYYYGVMLNNTAHPSQRKAAEQVSLFWPNQADRGAHVNVSGAGVTRHAQRRGEALRLLAFLLTSEAQQWYAEVNYEYPIREGIASRILGSWGPFKADPLNLSVLGDLNPQAVKLMDRAGWR